MKPYQMTQAAFMRAVRDRRATLMEFGQPVIFSQRSDHCKALAIDTHYRAVRDAFKSGVRISPAVLGDYPLLRVFGKERV